MHRKTCSNGSIHSPVLNRLQRRQEYACRPSCIANRQKVQDIDCLTINRFLARRGSLHSLRPCNKLTSALTFATRPFFQVYLLGLMQGVIVRRIRVKRFRRGLVRYQIVMQDPLRLAAKPVRMTHPLCTDGQHQTATIDTKRSGASTP